ncbi:isochorismate synthase [Ornithinibacillus sp. 179-J 7C1 HS]|uniref:isochorismate synthase n=1 Tax=Ornithinibacillus sp. 179-J 7C1 HS TaxID=3142384 RepID=UPI0039A2732D
MIEIKEDTLESTLIKAIQGLNPSETKLVSYTKKIANVDPLLFFEAGKYLHMNRSFWKSTIDQFTLVGIGTAYSIREEHSNLLKERWNTLQNQAIINNPFKISGTGIAAIGGMDFDSHKPRTALWESFASNELRVPTYMLTVCEEDTYLTVNVYVGREEDPLSLAEKLSENETFLLSHTDIETYQPTIKQQFEINPEEWKRTVKAATEHISAGSTNKIVLARELQLQLANKIQLTGVIRELIESQPTSYIFAFEQGDDCFIGASPERLVKVEKNDLLSTCLAGTAPRGSNDSEDEEFGHQLLHDQKNLEEHDFVVQMIRTSLEEFCKEIQVPNQPVLYKLRNLQHLYTPVRGKFKQGKSILDVIEKLHPTPALGGEPREAAIDFIRENEMLDRGWYGAPIGWIDSNEHGEFAVAIRSGLMKGNKASLFAGCGVVKDSDPEAEYIETGIKFLPMLKVLGG